MKFLVAIGLVLGQAGWLPGAEASAAPAAAAARPSDHVFILMLDGTRPDVLRRANAPAIQALVTAGVTFLQAETVYPSQTRVAFVSLPTGSYPGSHGIVGGDEIKDANWQNLETGDNDPIKAQALVARPTFFEEATAAGLTSLYAGMKGYELVGARGATWTINGKQTLDKTAYAARYEPRVEASAERALKYKQQLSRQLLDQSLEIIRKQRPNLVIINLGSADYVAHTYGPDTPGYAQTIELIDGLVKELVDTVRSLGLIERSTFIVSADHGFSAVDQSRPVLPRMEDGGHRVPALAQIGLEHFATNTGGASMGLYLREKTRLAEAVAALRREPWVESIYCEPAGAGCDLSLSALHDYFPGRSPDLMVDIDDDFSLNFPQPGQHGSHRPNDMRIPLIFSGAGVAHGVLAGKACLVDVAPTVLRLLGISPKILRADGRVLDEALAR